MRKCLAAFASLAMLAAGCATSGTTPGGDGLLSRMCANRDALRITQNSIIAGAQLIENSALRTAVILSAQNTLAILDTCPPRPAPDTPPTFPVEPDGSPGEPPERVDPG